MFREGLPFKNGQLLIPSLSQLQNKTIVALCMRLSVCEYAWIERQIVLCAYQCYAPLSPVQAIVGQGGDLINLHINCPNIRDIPNNQIPLQKVGDYWGFDTCSVTVQYTETIAVLKVSSEVIKCPTIGAASFGQSPYVARLLPVRGVVGHIIDRCISHTSISVPAPMSLPVTWLDGGSIYVLVFVDVGQVSPPV